MLEVKARIDAGEDVPDCLVKTLFNIQEEEKLGWEDLCMLSSVFTLGGVGSVSFNQVEGCGHSDETLDLTYYQLVSRFHPVVPEGSRART